MITDAYISSSDAPDLPTSIESASTAWLTAVLCSAGVLSQGEVVGIRHRANPAFNSRISHLTLTFSDDAPADAPRNLLLKLNADHEGGVEAAFYQLVATEPDHPRVVPACYAAAYSPQSGDSCLLIEDLSITHRSPVSREQILALEGVPSPTYLEQLIVTLARFHAYWWEHPRLGSGVTQVRWWYNDEEAYRLHVERRCTEFESFIRDVGDSFPDELRALYERLLSRMPGLWERCLRPRVTTLKGMTLTNGDCYLGQFLCPKGSEDGTTYLVDFQAASANFGAYDLSYLLPTFWTPEQRREDRREERLLRRYHEALQAHGVRGYGWEQLMTDYRLTVVLMVFDPIHDQVSGSGKNYWWPKLRCLTGAYRDLECEALLDG